MFSMLQVVIGIIFVLLLFSLLGTTIMELLAGALSLRSRNLEKALKNMLATSDSSEQVFFEFKNNSLYKQLSQNYGGRRYGPSYLSSDSFQSILVDIILKEEGFEKIEEQIDKLTDEDLKNVLRQFLREAESGVEGFKDNIRNWYDDIMDRASGWYKRYTQKILIAVGMTIAVVFNADTIAIYEQLEKDPVALQQVVSMAEDFVGADRQAIVQTDPDFRQSVEQLKELVQEEIQALESPLGLGWGNLNLSSLAFTDWLIKLLGWVVTALAVSLGAPFWFDLLRKIVNLRASGAKPS